MYAVKNKANIISFSNAEPDHLRSEPLEAAILSATSENILIVCAAGNAKPDSQPLNTDTTTVIPACYGHIKNKPKYDDNKFPATIPAALDSIISVASVNRDRMLSSFSNYGKNSIDIAAPGGELEKLANPAEADILRGCA